MSDPARLHDEQLAYWNGRGATQWVAHQDHTDRVLAPVQAALLETAAPRPGETVLDVGCGAGASTVKLAEQIRPGGHVTGLDVSAPLLELARRRPGGHPDIDWVLADAAHHAFVPAAFDLIASRFGVMFFGEPIPAFANLRRALRGGGRIAFVCWRPITDNPWMQVPLHAVYDAGVPRMPKPSPEAPGPFAFGDADRLIRILAGAGFASPRLDRLDLALDLAAGGGLEAAVEQVTNIGAASRALQEQPDDIRAAARASVRKALAAYVEGDGVRLPASVWLVSARVGAAA
jgi:SAM-dependent methyltransferase